MQSTESPQAPNPGMPLTPGMKREVRLHSTLYRAEAIVLLVLGAAALLLPAVASLTAALLFGWILLIGGGMGLASTLRSRQAPGFNWALVSAVVGIIAGLWLLFSPVAGVFSLTMILMAFLFADGLSSILYALDHRRSASPRWNRMMISGALDLLLAVLLLIGWPGTATWALGLILGFNLLFGGWALLGLVQSAEQRLP